MIKPTKPSYRPHSGPSPTANRFYRSCAHSEVFETNTGRTIALPVTPFPEIGDADGFLRYYFALLETDGSAGADMDLPDRPDARSVLRSQQRLRVRVSQNDNKYLLPYLKDWLDYLGIQSSFDDRRKTNELNVRGFNQIKALLDLTRDVCGDIPVRSYKYRSLMILELLITADLDDHARVDAVFSVAKPDRRTPDKRGRRKHVRADVEAFYGLGPTWGACKQLEAIDRAYDAHRVTVVAGTVSGVWLRAAMDGDGTMSTRESHKIVRPPGGIRHSGRAGFIAETYAATNVDDVASALGWVNATVESRSGSVKRVTNSRANIQRLVDHYRDHPPLAATRRAQLSCLIAGLRLSPTAPLQDHIDYITWAYDVRSVVRSVKACKRMKPLHVVIDEFRRHYHDHPWVEDTLRLVGDPVEIWC